MLIALDNPPNRSLRDRCLFAACACCQRTRALGSFHRLERSIHPIPGANIDLELPHTISTKRVITEVIVCKPVDATEDCGLSARIPQRPKPFTERILVLGGDVLEDFHIILAYKRITVKR